MRTVRPGISCRTFLSAVFATVRAEYENLTAQPKLALWFNIRQQYSESETAGILDIPIAGVRKQVAEGIFTLRASIAQKGIETDYYSLTRALAIMPVNRAPPSLKRKIEQLTATRTNMYTAQRG